MQPSRAQREGSQQRTTHVGQRNSVSIFGGAS
jgi:hypothetical protein